MCSSDLVRSFRRELDVEPNAQLQGAIERLADAAMAYGAALMGPMTSRWNIVQRRFGKTPPDEVNRLAEAYNTRRHELQAAVREYMASLEAPTRAMSTLRFPRLLRLPWQQR